MKSVNTGKTKTELRVNDNVVVVTGTDRGRKGKILKIDRRKVAVRRGVRRGAGGGPIPHPHPPAGHQG